VPPPTIPGDLRKLLLSLEEHPEGTDVTFVVEDTEILAHRLVLAMRSPVFAAELLGHMRESTTRRVQIDDMSASVFEAMLCFIYTDEFPLKPNNAVKRKRGLSLEEKNMTSSHESMVRDLLVAADRYDLERLRLMCEDILAESVNISTVMPTLLLVCGRQSCHQLEDSCIKYIASNPEVYAAVRATEEYKELKETCSSFIIELNERVATHNMACHTRSPSPSSSSRRPQEQSMSMFKPSEVVRGTHEFRIPNFSSVQRSISSSGCKMALR
jgi:speckle-type POZ protein